MTKDLSFVAPGAAGDLDQIRAWRDAIVKATHLASTGDIAVALQRVVANMGAHISAADANRVPNASAGVIRAAESLINADRAQELTDAHVKALENAIAIQRGKIQLPTPTVAQAPGAPPVTVPKVRGLYAWVARGASAALVLVHTRPTKASKAGVFNGEVVTSSTFYDGCAVEEWTGGIWFGPLRVDGVVAGTEAASGSGE